MRGVVLAILVALAASLSGCVPSLHPLVTDKDAVFLPSLVGTWIGEDGSDTWKFEKGEGKAYVLTQTSNGVSAHFEARLTKIGGVIFLDTFSKEPPDTEGKPAPADQSDEGNLFLYLHYVPAHLISRVGMSGDALRISMMDLDWFKQAIAARKIKIAHEDVEGGIMLTASTPELRKLALKLAAGKAAFNEGSLLYRTTKQAEPVSKPE